MISRVFIRTIWSLLALFVLLLHRSARMGLGERLPYELSGLGTTIVSSCFSHFLQIKLRTSYRPDASPEPQQRSDCIIA